MDIKTIASITVFASTLGFGIAPVVGDSFLQDSTNYYNPWNSAQGALNELNSNAAQYGDSYYNDTLNTRNALNKMQEDAYNASRF